MKLFAYNLREYDELPYFEKYSRMYGLDFDYTTDYPGPENYKLAAGCEIVCTIVCDLSAPVLDAFYAEGVRCIATRSIGVDHVDLDHARELGLTICHSVYSPSSVANYAIMLMLMCCRRITHILKRSELQDYSLKGKIGREISNCTIGVMGTGRIGFTVLKHLSGFGCRLLAYDLYPNESVREFAEYVDRDTLLRESDIITLHVPSTPENYHLINAESLKEMKDDVILINTARGDLIDTDALIDAIEAGKVGAAALDVLEKESGLYFHNLSGEVISNREISILRSFPNVILSPHTAFYTDEAVANEVESAFRGMAAYRDGTSNPYTV